MKSLIFLMILFFAHTATLWEPDRTLAGGYGDTLAHAALPGWYCSNVATWNLHTDRFLAPTGIDLSTAYDSPFPLILTCPLSGLGSQAQFHFFAALQILLVILSALLVARILFTDEVWRIAYVLAMWWTGFYVARAHEHFTLLSSLWGLQLLLWCWLTFDWSKRRNTIVRAVAVGLVMSGTFHNVAMLTPLAIVLLALSLKTALERLPWSEVAISFAIAIAVSAATFFVFFGPSVVAVLAGEFNPQAEGRSAYTLDLLGVFAPFRDHLVWRWLEAPAFATLEKTNPLDPVFLLILAATVVPKLALKGFWSSRRRRLFFALAVFYLVFALGPEIRFGDARVMDNPLFSVLSPIPPFSMSRTPARFAVVGAVLIAYLAFEALRESAMCAVRDRAVALALVAWILFAGPGINLMPFVPAYAYAHYLPEPGLETIRKSDPRSIVVHVPHAFAQDASQNFLQLKHQHRITSGYLGYTSYTAKTVEKVGEDPLLRNLACKGLWLAFQPTPFMSDPALVRTHMLVHDMKFLIFNKSLLALPECAELLSWSRMLMQQSWARVEDDTRFFTVVSVQ